MDTALTQHARFGGCGAKIGPGDLSNILCGIDIPEDANVIVGLKGFEDAGVYRITDDLAVVQTVDFFTPVVNDPYTFGSIAAANALSDIYAMGANPVTALNLVCFPPKKLDISILRDILRGGIDKVREAGASLLGGHSVDDDEVKYGLSVTGLVHPDRIVRNEGAGPGDLLVLTKPLGTGILISAMKGNQVSPETEAQVSSVMATLNRLASQAMLAAGAHAATDVTGFRPCGPSQGDDKGGCRRRNSRRNAALFSRSGGPCSRRVPPERLLQEQGFLLTVCRVGGGRLLV